MKADMIHWIGSILLKVTGYNGLQRPFNFVVNIVSGWNETTHSWMERNHACCSRHGYKRDFNKHGL
jgi:hypothetical protein